MECKDCKFYKLLNNGYHGQCVVDPKKHTNINPFNCQCIKFEKK